MKKLLWIVFIPIFLTGCSASTTVEEKECTISHKEHPDVYTYECEVMYVEDQDIWDDLTVESRYRMHVTEDGKLVEAEFLSNPQTIRFT